MPDQVITAVPATHVKRKTREEEDSDDEGSDVVSSAKLRSLRSDMSAYFPTSLPFRA